MEWLDIKPAGKYVDVTFGGGGHSREILKHLGAEGHLYSFDQDEDAQRNIVDDDRFTFVYSNFKYLKNFMLYHGVEGVDGILADLGVSFHHFDDSERGFSFRFDAPLDMRMNKKARCTAADILATYDEKRLAQLFSLYGELRNAHRMAAAIVAKRDKGGVKTTGLQISCIEEIAWSKGWIDGAQLKKLADGYGKSTYGAYLRGLVP